MKDEALYILLIYLAVGLALIWAAYNAYAVISIQIIDL